MLTPEQIKALAEYAGLVEADPPGTFREATETELETTPSPLVDWKNAEIARHRTTAHFLANVDRVPRTMARASISKSAALAVELLDSLYSGSD